MNIKELKIKLNRLASLPRTLNLHLGNIVLAEIKESFVSQKDPITSKAWQPLSAKTLAQKNRSYARAKKGKVAVGFRILRASGALEDNWSIEATDQSVTVSNNSKAANGAPYGLFHQMGTKKLPRRRFLPIDDAGALSKDLQAEIQKAIKNTIEKG